MAGRGMQRLKQQGVDGALQWGKGRGSWGHGTVDIVQARDNKHQHHPQHQGIWRPQPEANSLHLPNKTKLMPRGPAGTHDP